MKVRENPNPYALAPVAALMLQLEATRLLAGGVMPHGTIGELAAFVEDRLVDVRRLGGGQA